ncbi:hypothetical protein LTS18_004744, partial [Coniosporium uncinatum]
MNLPKERKQSRASQGVIKSKRPRGRSTLLDAAKKDTDKPQDTGSRPRKVRAREEMEMKKAASTAEKTSNKPE